MVSIGKLNYELGLDTKDFVKGAKATQQEMRAQRRIMRETDTAADKYEKSWKDIQNAYKKGHISADRARRALDKLHGEMRQGTKSSSPLIGQLKGMAPSLSGMGPAALAAGAGIAIFAAELKAFQFISEQIASQFPLIDETAKAARAIDIATESLIAFRHQANLMSGVDAPVVDKALKDMQRNIGDAIANPAGQTAKLLKRLGGNAAELARDPEAALRFFADAIKNAKTQAEALEIAQVAFGRGGKDLVTTLRGGSEAIEQYRKEAEALGIAFSDIDARMIEEVNDNFARMEMHLQGIKTQAALAIGDELNSALIITLELIKAMPEYFSKIAAQLQAVREAAGPLGDMAIGFAGAITGAAGAEAIVRPVAEQATRQVELDAQLAEQRKKREEEAEAVAAADVDANGAAWEMPKEGPFDAAYEEAERERADRKRHNDAMDSLYEKEKATYEKQLEQIDKEIEDAKKAEEDRLEHNKRVKESRDHDILVAAGSQRARTMELRARGFGPKKEVQQVRIADDQLDELVKERETIVEMEDEVGRPV